MATARWPAAGGVAGPVVFVAAWATLGARAEGYDPTRQAISRLATTGAPSRLALTAALVVLGTGMILFGLALRPARAWPLAVLNGLAALAVAALPLGGRYDTAHGLAAAVGYVTLAALPLGRAGDGRLAVLLAVVCGASLLAGAVGVRAGLLQRIGLTVGHAWVVAEAVRLLAAGHPSSKRPPRCLARKRSAAA